MFGITHVRCVPRLVHICLGSLAWWLIVTAPTLAQAQATATATLTGMVVDESGAVLDGASVTATNPATMLDRQTSTNAEGQFTISLLPPGTYVLRVERLGFMPADIPDVVVTVDDPTAVRVQLKVEPVSESVVVTAQRREERLQDVPVPVTVVNADKLMSNGQVLLRDYFQEIPGVGLAPNYLGQQKVSIRGITTGGTSSPTVAVMIDDIPYGGTVDTQSSQYVPDLDPYELAHIEVLRGPQGALYGAGSMGGIIKYVTKDPSTDRFSGRFTAGTSGIDNGTEPGFDFRGSLNIPVNKSLAVRASAFTRQTSGYIDNPVYQLEGVNETTANGGRVLALWRPTTDISLRLSAMYQRDEQDGATEVVKATDLGDLQQNYLPGTHESKATRGAYSAAFKATLGGVDVMSVTGFNRSTINFWDDRTWAYGTQAQATFGNRNAPYYLITGQRTFTQELRFEGTLGPKAQWLMGGFYTKQRNPKVWIDIYGQTSTGALITDPIFLMNRSPAPHSTDVPAAEFRESAAFGNFTYAFTDRFDVQLGGRMSYDTVDTFGNLSEGALLRLLLGQTGPTLSPDTSSDTNAFTYLATPRFRVRRDLMVYGRFASGFRPGGANATLGNPTVPPEYESDTTSTYELGVKADLFDGRLSVDTSVYYVDWRDIQITLRDPFAGVAYNFNGSRAKSEGVELAVGTRPMDRLTVSGWMSYDNAVLTEDFPTNATLYGRGGDRLPQTPRFSGNLSLEQEFPIRSGLSGYAGGQASFVGSRIGIFQATSTREYLPSYTKVDLRGGLRSGYWDVNLYITNVGNGRGIINGGLGYLPPTAYALIQPRTFGLTISRMLTF